jgi:hypothetical protein
MNHRTGFIYALAVIFILGGLPAFAQRGHPSGGPGKSPGMPSTPSRTSMPDRSNTNGNNGTKQETGRETAVMHQNERINDQLSHNTALSSKVETLTGMKAQDACSGFKNLGQCVAAAHVGHNLGMNFDSLKGKLTGSNAESLGQAIHELNPQVDAKAEAKKANKQAKDETGKRFIPSKTDQ